jgi:hypothetical protein
LKQDGCTVCTERTIDMEIVLDAPDELLGDVAMWNLVSVCSEMVLALGQDRCKVCARRTMGLEIGLDAPSGTPRSQGSSEYSFLSVWR